jgi:hypothetical protein
VGNAPSRLSTGAPRAGVPCCRTMHFWRSFIPLYLAQILDISRSLSPDVHVDQATASHAHADGHSARAGLGTTSRTNGRAGRYRARSSFVQTQQRIAAAGVTFAAAALGTGPGPMLARPCARKADDEPARAGDWTKPMSSFLRTSAHTRPADLMRSDEQRKHDAARISRRSCVRDRGLPWLTGVRRQASSFDAAQCADTLEAVAKPLLDYSFRVTPRPYLLRSGSGQPWSSHRWLRRGPAHTGVTARLGSPGSRRPSLYNRATGCILLRRFAGDALHCGTGRG